MHRSLRPLKSSCLIFHLHSVIMDFSVRLSLHRHYCTSRAPARTFLASRDDTPADWPVEKLRHRFLNGSYLPAHKLRKGEIAGVGVEMDEDKEWKRRDRELAIQALKLVKMTNLDPHTADLRSLDPDHLLMPPASAFIPIHCASPWFRISRLTTYHHGLLEVPWTEITSIVIGENSIPNKEIVRVGSCIQLYDASLSHRTEGYDSPLLFGQIKDFEGIDDSHVLASVYIFSFYRFNNFEPLSAHTCRPWLEGSRDVEETLIVLSRSRCRFSPRPLLQYEGTQLAGFPYLDSYSNPQRMDWGPKRPWHRNPNWRYPSINRIRRQNATLTHFGLKGHKREDSIGREQVE